MISIFTFQVLLTLCATLFGTGKALPTGDVTEDLVTARDVNSGFLSFGVTVRNATSDGAVKRDSLPSAPLTRRDWRYTVDLYAGSNKQKITVEVDTGSADLWFYDSNATSGFFDFGTYNPSESTTSKPLNQTFDEGYFDGTWAHGSYYLDDITLPSGQVLPQFQFLDATAGNEENGILGIGVVGASIEDAPYPNFPIALKNAGLISKVAYSLYLNSSDGCGGNLIFGGIDTAKYSGDIYYGSSLDYNIATAIDSITVNGSTYPVNTSMAFDSGTTYTNWPNQIVEVLSEVLVGAKKTNGYWWANCDQPDESASLNFGTTSIQIPLSGLVAGSGGICQIRASGTDYPILGDDILRYFYLVYDYEDKKLGVAQAVYTSESNIVPIQ